MVVEWSRALLIRPSHAQGRGFKLRRRIYFFVFQLIGSQNISPCADKNTHAQLFRACTRNLDFRTGVIMKSTHVITHGRSTRHWMDLSFSLSKLKALYRLRQRTLIVWRTRLPSSQERWNLLHTGLMR